MILSDLLAIIFTDPLGKKNTYFCFTFKILLKVSEKTSESKGGHTFTLRNLHKCVLSSRLIKTQLQEISLTI